jgi:hypothetical protein
MENRVASTAASTNRVRVIARVLATGWGALWVLFILFYLGAALIAKTREPIRWEGFLFMALALVVVTVPTVLAGVLFVVSGRKPGRST